MDRIWKLPQKKIKEGLFRQAAAEVAQGYAGVTLENEREADDCLSFFFIVPPGEETGHQSVTLELSIYDMGRDGIVLSLEPDAGENNRYWDEASQIAEDLADELGANPLSL